MPSKITAVTVLFLTMIFLPANDLYAGSCEQLLPIFRAAKKSRTAIVIFSDGNTTYTNGRIHISNGVQTTRKPGSVWFVGEGGLKTGSEYFAEGKKYVINNQSDPEEIPFECISVYETTQSQTEVFEKAGGKGNVLLNLKSGEKVELLFPGKGSENSRWDKIRYDNIEGWILSKNLKNVEFMENSASLQKAKEITGNIEKTKGPNDQLSSTKKLGDLFFSTQGCVFKYNTVFRRDELVCPVQIKNSSKKQKNISVEARLNGGRSCFIGSSKKQYPADIEINGILTNSTEDLSLEPGEVKTVSFIIAKPLDTETLDLRIGISQYDKTVFLKNIPVK